MKKNNNLDIIKNNYINTPIPKELDSVVNKALSKSKKQNKAHKYIKHISTVVASLTIATLVLTVGVNTNTVLAEKLSDVPIVGEVVRLVTFKQYSVNEDTYEANIKTPVIEGLDNKELENSLNEKYIAENEKLYTEFMTEMEDLEKNGGGHMGVDSGYIVKTDNDRILSVGRYVVNTVGSSSTTFKYDTIDKKNEVLVTLPSLFKDDSYIETISQNIKEQMLEQYKADSNKFYWVEGIKNEGFTELFEEISSEQSFYINPEGKLVISFDKYEVAPGYMGVVEFVIPTETIKDILVSDELVK